MFQTESDVSRQKSSKAESVLREVVGVFGELPSRLQGKELLCKLNDGYKAAGLDPTKTKWVMTVSLNPGGIAGGSGTQYFVGDFDGSRFVADSGSATTRWADYGSDFYAAVSWNGVPRSDGRRVWIGWMSNWTYAQDVPTSPWRSATRLC